MNKLFSKIAALSVGLTMAVGVGVALGSKKAEVVKAATATYSMTPNAATSGSSSTSYVTTDTDFTYNEVDWTFRQWNPKTLQVKANQGTAGNEFCFYSGAFAGTITKVVISFKSIGSITDAAKFMMKGSTTAFTSQQSSGGSSMTWDSDELTLTWTASESAGYVAIAFYQNGKAMGGSNFLAESDAIVVTYEAGSVKKDMGIRNNSYASGPFEVTYGDTSEYHYALAYDVDTDQSIKEGVSWVISDESVIDYVVDSWTWLAYKPKAVGTTTITASCEGYKDVSTTITVVPGTLQSLAISGSMSKTSYYVGESWNPNGFTVTATYDSGYVGNVTDEVAWTYSPSAPALSVTSVVATASLGAKSVSSSAQTVSVAKTNQIQNVYLQSSGASIDVYGYYVGYLTHTNKDGTFYDVIIQDGEYGVMAYGAFNSEPTSFTVNETILHVTGSLSIYNGLYEITNPTVVEATSVPEASVPSTPVVYAAKGGETQEYASRLTTVTGVPTYSGTIGEAGASDLTLPFTVGTRSITVFYKKAAQTADAEAFAAVKEAVANSSEITVKGFTGWYNGFQVQMNGYVKPAEDYTAEDFAQDLLDQTDAVCTGWKEGDDNHDALEAIWSNLASNDKYPSLPSDQKTILAEAARDESGTVVERAMARYDFLTGKYNLSNFINGRTPVEVMRFGYNELTNDNTMVIVVVIAAVSALAFTTLLVFKKKKQK